MQPISFGDEGQIAARALRSRYEAAVKAWGRSLEGADRPVGELGRRFATLEAIDRQYGGNAPLGLEDAEDLVASVLTDLAQLEAEAGRRRMEAALDDIASLTVATALWAIRHEVALPVVEPVVNALARESNRARSKQQLAAVFGLMQGVIRHTSPRLSADLERSNPERPWRMLHLNLAITAIRTEDPAMIDYAFDALDEALPGERAGFYAEALALALSPRVANGVRNQIEQRHLKWTPRP